MIFLCGDKMNTQLFIQKPNTANPWIYFLATCIWTWSFFGITYWLGLSGETGGIMGAALVLAALSGPSVMAIIFISFALTKEGKQDYWKRIIDYKRIKFKWYLVIFLMIPTISILASLLSGYWNSPSFLSNKLHSLFLFIIVVPLVPVLEELGWRGYVLDRLQEKYSSLNSSIILGIVWGFWHLPAFFLPGGALSAMPFGSFTFWLYMITIIELSICFTWIYNNTGRSTLAAILFHIALEISSNHGLVPYDQPEHLYNVALWSIIIICISIKYELLQLGKPVAHQEDFS